MVWRVSHYPSGATPSRDYAVRAPSLDVAKRKLPTVLDVPLWTLR